MQRRVHRVLDIDDVALINGDAVDLEGISCFERFLPSFLPQRDVALLFRHELRLIDMDPRTLQQDIRDDPSREKLLQLNVEPQHRDVSDWWMRMRLLDDRESFERENSADQLQMRVLEPDVVAGELLVHRGLSSGADDVVEEERPDE